MGIKVAAEHIIRAVVPDKTLTAAAELANGVSEEVDAMSTDSFIGNTMVKASAAIEGLLLSPFVLLPSLAYDVADVVLEPVKAVKAATQPDPKDYNLVSGLASKPD